MMSRLGLEAMMFRLGLGRFGPRSSSATYRPGSKLVGDYVAAVSFFD